MAKSGKKRSVAGSQGFGKPLSVPTRDAIRFMKAVRQTITEAKGDEKKVYRFFEANLNKLDESLLEALPAVFTKATSHERQGQQEKTTALFCNFGVFISQFPLGDHAVNLELAVGVYQLTLRVFLKEESPEIWATTQNNLGVAYRNRIRGKRVENLEKAITAYELALEIRTREALPEDWAKTQNNLGSAYGDRIRGERAENLEKAIAAYELALEVYTHGAFQEDWATTQNNLGLAYKDRIQGERAENLEKAIAAYELALEVLTREALPEYWAMTQNNLGITYRDRIRGERAENLEKAITAHELALEVYIREARPKDWAMTQNNLGITYRDRIRGERAENLEEAIIAHELALEVYIREAFPEDWAMARHNLANAYRDRVKGTMERNLEESILLHSQAAEVFTRESFPDKWAENQTRLAESFMKRASLLGDFADLDSAISLLQDAIEVATPNSPHWIDTQHLIGKAFARRYDNSENPQDLKQALLAYKLALEAISPEHYDRSKIWTALPITQSILGSRLVRDGQWREGLQLLLNSVRHLSSGEDDLAYAKALFEIGRTYDTALSDWNNARLYYRDALRLYKHLNNLSGIAETQADLGGVLLSQGHFEQGLSHLAEAHEGCLQLKMPERAARVKQLYQVAKKEIKDQKIGVPV